LLTLRRLLRDARIRGETAWVVAHKAAEFGVLLVGLKLFTNLMSPAEFGEYQLALTTLALLGFVVEVPISQVYLRQYHTAVAQGTARSALTQTVKWLGITALIVLGGSILLTKPLADAFRLETFTVLAVGLTFLANRWRSLRVQVLDIQRERRQCMIENIGFYACQTAIGAVALLIFRPSATVALLAFAVVAAVFSGIGVRSFHRELRMLPDQAPAPFSQLVFAYGVPLGILTTCQWLQASAERYALSGQFDYALVGRYVAAYQVCGFPFLAMNAVLTTLVQPIVFQRAQDISDAGQLWSAHRLLLGGMGLYLGLGALFIAAYAACGPLLLRLLASEAYAIPVGILTVLAAGRMLMFSGLLQHMFFKVHQQTRFLLLYSIIGGGVAVSAAWLLVRTYGILGAALAVLITALVYNGLLTFAPGGTWSLVRGVRRSLAPTPVRHSLLIGDWPEVNL
jgi:O-antigen/teichoic acid export membrane protein